MRNFLASFIFALSLFTFLSPVSAESVWDKPTEALTEPVEIVVYRSPTCGCCSKWLDHLRKHQFDVKDVVTDDMDEIKQKFQVPGTMASCHTGIVDGYIVEGHVPAGDIKAMLKLRPEMSGIAVPGMDTGTPGMEMGDRKDPFKVIAFDKGERFQVFHSYDQY